jgi:uncharacterized membrane protein YjfL (UPF0719 family)
VSFEAFAFARDWRLEARDFGQTFYGALRMEWRVIGLNFLYAILGVVLMFGAYRLIDVLTPSVDFQAELKNGNVAVAIFIAALFLAIAIIIGGALN